MHVEFDEYDCEEHDAGQDEGDEMRVHKDEQAQGDIDHNIVVEPELGVGFELALHSVLDDDAEEIQCQGGGKQINRAQMTDRQKSCFGEYSQLEEVERVLV